MAQTKQIVDALVRSRRTGIAATAALGGLALVAGLAARALRTTETRSASDGATAFDPSSVGEDEARLMLRAMVAATLADGLVDDGERKRLDEAVEAAGIDADGQLWLRTELADPADVDEIAERVKDPDQAVRIYTAARLSIEADTLQEREFLKMLGTALDVPAEAMRRIEAEA